MQYDTKTPRMLLARCAKMISSKVQCAQNLKQVSFQMFLEINVVHLVHASLLPRLGGDVFYHRCTCGLLTHPAFISLVSQVAFIRLCATSAS
jgi:hypothetical protein